MGLNREQDEVIELLYREMYASLCNYAMNALDDRQLAEEAVQDAFRIACMRPDSLMGSDNRKGWLMSTLKNVICNIRRSRARLNNLVISAVSIDDLKIEAPSSDNSFEMIYSDLLGQDDFELLKMIVINKYTMLEASTELGVSVEACKKRVQRAKRKLKNLIDNTI